MQVRASDYKYQHLFRLFVCFSCVMKGSAYIYRADSLNSWTEVSHLYASDGAALDLFSSSIGLYSKTAIIGAQASDTPAGSNAGLSIEYTLIS